MGPVQARSIVFHDSPPFNAALNTRREAHRIRAGTSLVRALALHGVARPGAYGTVLAALAPRHCRLRSHLASPLRPGRGVLIRSVSRRLGSVAYVREDASPNEVSLSNSFRGCPIDQTKVNSEQPASSPRSSRSTTTTSGRGWISTIMVRPKITESYCHQARSRFRDHTPDHDHGRSPHERPSAMNCHIQPGRRHQPPDELPHPAGPPTPTPR